ncbi:hypothetical protein H0A58_12780 [Alcaligenaceae bacterium]|nr:hypothetical protein [Alcaligenaceae bacterium]
MDQTLQPNLIKPTAPVKLGVLAAVFLISLGFLALQLTMARLLSAVLSHHYVFAILSLAMLGLGLGGVLAHAFHTRKIAPQDDRHRLVWYGLVASGSIPLAVLLIFWMADQAALYQQVFWYFLVVLWPFVMGGLFFAEVYRQYSHWAARLYATDLIGAAVGGSFAVVLLNIMGGLAGTVFISTLLAVGSLCLLPGLVKPHRLVSTLVLGMLSTSLVMGLSIGGNTGSLSLFQNLNPDKEIYDALYGPWEGEITDTRWSAFGRTQLVTYRKNPAHRDIYIDGTAGTPMYQFSGDFSRPGKAVQDLFQYFPGATPFRVMQDYPRDSALIIGPGGGRDILLAAGSGYAKVVAAEVNPDLLNIVRDSSAYNGGLYTDFEHIQVVQAEGRHYIKRDQSSYDLIMMSLPVTNTSRSREGFALTENYLLTEQAIGDYFDHLNTQGQLLIITHDELAVVRLLRVTLDALAQRGLDTQAAMQHIYVLGSFPYPIMVVGKQALSRQDAAQVFREVRRNDYSTSASFVPHFNQRGAGNPMLQALAAGHLDIPKMMQLVAEHGHDISAVTDNRPFFYKTDLSIPKPLHILLITALSTSALALMIPTVFGMRVPGDVTHATANPKRRRLIRISVLFALLGLGFMLIEVSLMQRLTFFLGEPVLALAVLLGAILVFMGMGSLLSARIPTSHARQAISYIAFAIGVLSVAYTLWLPDILSGLLHYELQARILWAIAIILPLALLLGMPFPLALRVIRAASAAWAVPWMWAINGVFSVLGAALAVIVAMYHGLDQVIWLAAVCYFLCGLAATGRTTA